MPLVGRGGTVLSSSNDVGKGRLRTRGEPDREVIRAEANDDGRSVVVISLPDLRARFVAMMSCRDTLLVLGKPGRLPPISIARTLGVAASLKGGLIVANGFEDSYGNGES